MRVLPTKPRTSDDGAAIALSLKRPEAFTAVFDRHFTAVHRYLARRTDRDLADDLASQVFTIAFANRGRYRDELGTARPWLFGIATNLLRAEYRVLRHKADVVEKLASEAAHQSSVTELRTASSVTEDDERLSVALSRLPPEQRDALLLHALGELSYAEVALALEVPVGTIRSRISRACAALRLELETPAAVAGERRNHG